MFIILAVSVNVIDAVSLVSSTWNNNVKFLLVFNEQSVTLTANLLYNSGLVLVGKFGLPLSSQFCCSCRVYNNYYSSSSLSPCFLCPFLSVVVEAGKDVTSLLFILGGFTLMGLLFYYVGSEFFSSNSPSTIFTKALKRVKADERVNNSAYYTVN